MVVNPNSVGRLPLRNRRARYRLETPICCGPVARPDQAGKDKRTEKGLGGRLLPGQVYLAGAVCIEAGGPASERNRRNRRRNRVVRGGLVEQRKSMHTVTFYNAISRDERLVLARDQFHHRLASATRNPSSTPSGMAIARSPFGVLWSPSVVPQAAASPSPHEPAPRSSTPPSHPRCHPAPRLNIGASR